MASITDGPVSTWTERGPGGVFRLLIQGLIDAAVRQDEARLRWAALRAVYDETTDPRMLDDIGLAPPPNAFVRNHWLTGIVSQ